METACLIDGLNLSQLLHPQTVVDLSDIVRRAGADKQAVYPLGGRTMLDVGLSPRAPGLGVDLRSLAQVIDYPARDMTITVQAGITIAALQQTLAAEGQRLPIDVPCPERATLGGVLALNVSGPRRLGAGTLRDYVIGISTLNDDGQETKAGGRVVKNVAGYDLCKLHIGALGTLGIITQVTLKVRPVPQTQALVTFGCSTSELAALLDRLHASRTLPLCVDVLNARAARVLREQTQLSLPESPCVVVVGYEDSEDTVNWQLKQVITELMPAGVRSVEALAGAVARPLWNALTDLTAWPAARLTLKANLPPALSADWFCRADAAAGDLLVCGQAASGILRAHLVAESSLEQGKSLVETLTAPALAAGGNVVLPRCPVAWKHQLPIWGRPRADAWLMRRLHEQMVPRRIFNPGRFLDAN